MEYRKLVFLVAILLRTRRIVSVLRYEESNLIRIFFSNGECVEFRAINIKAWKKDTMTGEYKLLEKDEKEEDND